MENTLPQKSKLQELLSAWPIIQFAVTGLLCVVGSWTAIQLAQASQAAEIRESRQRIEKLEKESVPRELFDERTLRILEEQRKLNDRFDRFLEKQQ